jgi:transcriptional regulator of acetoin/glycerol metabolism
MLARASPQHSLSNDAIEAISANPTNTNLFDLDRNVRTLAIHHHEGIIRLEGVIRILGHRQLDVSACVRCTGQVIKEVRCIEIRKSVRDSNGNVALAARQLGISRNTVYAHAAE